MLWLLKEIMTHSWSWKRVTWNNKKMVLITFLSSGIFSLIGLIAFLFNFSLENVPSKINIGMFLLMHGFLNTNNNNFLYIYKKVFPSHLVYFNCIKSNSTMIRLCICFIIITKLLVRSLMFLGLTGIIY